MNRFFVLALLVGASACSLRAQVVDTTVCDILNAPQSFDGKIVRIKGTVVAGFNQFVVKGPDCGRKVNAIWLAYPEKSKGKAGPAAYVQLQPARNFAGTYAAKTRATLTLEKSKDFKQFDSALVVPYNYKAEGMCLTCGRNEVSATLVGRIDSVADPSIHRDAAGKITSLGGFGNMNAYSARLVLQSVSDVTIKEVDYSKAEIGPKVGWVPVLGPPPGSDQDFFDPVADAVKFASTLPSGTPSRVQADHGSSVLPKRGEHNGVNVILGNTSEAAQKFEDQSTQDSPDGVIYNCLIYQDELKDKALSIAIFHSGLLVADMRNPAPDLDLNTLFSREYHALAVTAIASMANQVKILVLPGGYLLWNSAWVGEERTTKLDEGLSGYLSKEQLLSK